MSQRVTVGCKVNFSLRITGVREDGYHELDSLFWPLALPCDTLTFERTDGQQGFEVLCDTAGIDAQHNTLTKTYQAYKAATGFAPFGRVLLEKGIPHGAGLGGGSSDAAAVLRWCNDAAPHPLDLTALSAIALKVGADVPFFLHNVPCRVRGIGENIQPCHNFLQGKAVLLACPHTAISTPWAYAAWDNAQKEKFFLEDLTTWGVKAKSLVSCASYFSNDFEEVVFSQYPHLRDIKERLLIHQALAVVMSGSGASIAAIFPTLQEAECTAQCIGRQDLKVFVDFL